MAKASGWELKMFGVQIVWAAKRQPSGRGWAFSFSIYNPPEDLS